MKTYWPDFPDWRAWKAQLYQESHLDPLAKSGVGAVGLAQFMPGTWDDITRQLNFKGDRTAAALSIAAGAYYMARLRQQWKRDRDPPQRHILAEASYNAGLGNILASQKLCNGAAMWPDIAPCLERVTGAAHARETSGYIVSIRRIWAVMTLEQ